MFCVFILLCISPVVTLLLLPVAKAVVMVNLNHSTQHITRWHFSCKCISTCHRTISIFPTPTCCYISHSSLPLWQVNHCTHFCIILLPLLCHFMWHNCLVSAALAALKLWPLLLVNATHKHQFFPLALRRYCGELLFSVSCAGKVRLFILLFLLLIAIFLRLFLWVLTCKQIWFGPNLAAQCTLAACDRRGFLPSFLFWNWKFVT